MISEPSLWLAISCDTRWKRRKVSNSVIGLVRIGGWMLSSSSPSAQSSKASVVFYSEKRQSCSSSLPVLAKSYRSCSVRCVVLKWSEPSTAPVSSVIELGRQVQVQSRCPEQAAALHCFCCVSDSFAVSSLLDVCGLLLRIIGNKCQEQLANSSADTGNPRFSGDSFGQREDERVRDEGIMVDTIT